MNILFLDFDGVILPFGAYNWSLDKVFAKPYNYIDRMASRAVGVDKIIEYCERTNSKIVLISTWRYLFSEQFLRDYLTKLGLEPYLHTEWLAIDENFNYREKKHDLVNWIATHKPESWKIVDDHDCGVGTTNWIRTESYTGITEDTFASI